MSSSKFKLESLENCANFLKIEIEDENKKKKYTNKADLADRLIMKIESLFPQTCQECKEEYCSTFTDHPDIFFECFLCTQLSHSCEKIKSKYESIKNCVLPLGMIWLCTGCHEKNNYYGKKGVTGVTDLTKSESPVPQSNDEKITGIQTDSRQSDFANPEKEATIPVCNHYRHGKCPHGLNGNRLVNGKKCEFNHPKRCMRFCRYGSTHHHGCSYGSSCYQFHPILCRNSVRYGQCNKESCTYVHLVNTSRSRPNSSHYSTYQNSTYQKSYNKNQHRSQSNHKYNNQHLYKPYNVELPYTNQDNYHPQEEPNNRLYHVDPGPGPYQPEPAPFLDILKQIREIASEMKQYRKEVNELKTCVTQYQFPTLQHPAPFQPWSVPTTEQNQWNQNQNCPH